MVFAAVATGFLACGGESSRDETSTGGTTAGGTGATPSGGGVSGTGANGGLGATGGGGTGAVPTGGGGTPSQQCNTGSGGIAGAFYTPSSAWCEGNTPMIADIKGFPAKKPACSGATPYCKVADCTANTEPLFCCSGKTPLCSECPPGSVSTGTYCIDQYEVTRGSYETWLATQPPPGSTCPSYAPDATCMGLSPVCKTGCEKHPQVCVSACQASAYCGAHGKLVCHIDQLTLACPTKYPYGADYDPTACNGTEAGLGTTAPVGSFTKCVTQALDGPIFDLSGNVAELAYVSAGTYTHAGGGFSSLKDALACEGGLVLTPTDISPSLGFRCCTQK